MAQLIAIFIGAVIGVASGRGFGLVVGALLGWLLVRVFALHSEITALRTSVQVLRAVHKAATELEASPAPDAAVATATAASQEEALAASGVVAVSEVAIRAAPVALQAAPVPAAPVPVIARSLDVTSRAGPDAVPMSEAPVATASPVRVPPPPSQQPAWERLRQWLVGGNTIVKAGVAILFVGLAFLAKYAAEHTRLPPELRLAAIGAAAIVLLGFGWRLRVSRPGYAQVLQGGAVAVLYLTLFAAFRYYGVLAAGPAFALMAAVAALAAALAVLQDARSLAVVGVLGGFATPLIVATGSDNAAALFAYYFVLDAGIAAVAWFRTWRSLNLVGFAATFVVGTAWGVQRYSAESFAMSESFLIAFFLLFVLIMLLPARRAVVASPPPLRSDGWVNSTLLFGLPTITFALQYGLVRDTVFGTALSALALAGFYALLASSMKQRPELSITFDASLAIATVFLTLVIPFALDPRSTAGAWTLESAGLVWIGFRQRRGLPRAFGYLLFLGSGLAMLFAHERYGQPTVVFDAYLFNGLMAGGAAIAAAFFVHTNRRSGAMNHGEEVAEAVLIALGTLWLLSTAGLEISAFVDTRFRLAAALVAAGAVVLLYVLLEGRLDWSSIAWPAAAHAPLLFVAAAYTAGQLANPLRDGGAWAWPIAFAVHALVLRAAAPRWPDAVADAVHAIGFIALALLGALLGRAATADWGDAASAWPWLGWLVVPAAFLLWLAQPSSVDVWPARAAPTAYRLAAAAVLATGLWLWTLVANVASDGTAAPLPHAPLLNPLDVGVALALVAILLWLRGVGRAAGPPLGLVAAAGFVWLNAMLVRAFHHYGGVPYQIDAWLGSLAVQTGIALLWALTALIAMWFGARRGERVPWVVGAALLAAVVFKLLLVDLSGTGTVTRIVSFIGVGVLMLVIGYVAPLPAKETSHASA